MNHCVRPAIEADISALCEIGQGDPSFAVSERIRYYEPEEVQEWIESPKDNLFLVAETDGRIAGFLFCKVMSSHWAMLDNFYIRPEFRGSGCASSMLEALNDRLRETGIQYLSTLCADEDAETAAWLGRRGFTRTRKYYWFERFLG